MAAQIILIVNGEVMRDDGDVIRHMLERITQSTDHLDRMETQVASRRQVEDTELAAQRADLENLKTQLHNMLTLPNLVTVERAQLAALGQQLDENTQRIQSIVPDRHDERT
jgi:uncharacterized membrane protein YccC